MGWLFLIFAAVTVAGAVAAVTLRQLIHSALCLAVSFFGLALLYLQLEAQFIGLAQVLVYVGAVAILVVFAILLTRGVEAASEPRWARLPALGAAVAGVVLVALVVAVSTSGVGREWPEPALTVAEEAAVIQIGLSLMTQYVVPLLVIAVLLTVALIGAVLIAMEEPRIATGSPGTAEPPGAGARADHKVEGHGKEEA
jgi:NADH-quinone oxidoreductase subunit J